MGTTSSPEVVFLTEHLLHEFKLFCQAVGIHEDIDEKDSEARSAVRYRMNTTVNVDVVNRRVWIREYGRPKRRDRRRGDGIEYDYPNDQGVKRECVLSLGGVGKMTELVVIGETFSHQDVIVECIIQCLIANCGANLAKSERFLDVQPRSYMSISTDVEDRRLPSLWFLANQIQQEFTRDFLTSVSVKEVKGVWTAG